jgi:hypothetical protein
MNEDVTEAHEQLRAAVALANNAEREFAEAFRATADEAMRLWEDVGAHIVPSALGDVLAIAADLLSEPRLAQLPGIGEQRRQALAQARADLLDATLAAEEFEAITIRRRQVDERLAQARSRWKEHRAQPGVLDAVAAAARGTRVRPALAPLVDEHEQLERAIRELEAEAARLSSVVARHHRASKEAGPIDQKLQEIAVAILQEARTLALQALVRRPALRDRFPALARVFRRIDGLVAKQAILAALFERWVRPFSVELNELHGIGATVSGFELATWPTRVALRVQDATQPIETFRRVCPAVLAFDAYDGVADDWWGAIVPDVDRPPAATPTNGGDGGDSDGAQRAADRLAAVWASFQTAPPGDSPPLATNDD